MKRYHSFIRFTAQGCALPQFRDALREYGVKCIRQSMRNGMFCAQIRPKYRRALQTIAETYEITLTIVEEKGLRFRLRPFRARYGLIVGLIPAIAFLWWSNQTVRSIEIYGNTEISDTHMLTALKELGVTCGTRYDTMDFSLLEQQLRLTVSDIEWVTLRRTGGRLVVELEEETDPPERYADRIPTNYIATVSAQITEMQVYNGQAMVKVGDAVKEGDVLINGVIEDQRGISYLKHADGLIRGVYQETLNLYQPFCQEVTIAGKTVTETYLECFGKRISLSPNVSISTGDFIYTEETEPLVLWGLRLPFAMLRCNYTMQETTIAVYSPQEIAAMQDDTALRFEQNFHADDQILGKDYVQTVDDLGISLKIDYIFEGVIGKTSEIFVKKQ